VAFSNNFPFLDSTQVQVDDAGEKVRPVTKRCTMILREIPEDANEEEVKAMFDGFPYQSLSYAGSSYRRGVF
jgi:hypothetical protein